MLHPSADLSSMRARVMVPALARASMDHGIQGDLLDARSNAPSMGRAEPALRFSQASSQEVGPLHESRALRMNITNIESEVFDVGDVHAPGWWPAFLSMWFC